MWYLPNTCEFRSITHDIIRNILFLIILDILFIKKALHQHAFSLSHKCIPNQILSSVDHV